MIKFPKKLPPEMYRMIRIAVLLALASIVHREDPEFFKSVIVEVAKTLIH